MPYKVCARCKAGKEIDELCLPKREYCKPCSNARITKWKHERRRRFLEDNPKPPAPTDKRCSRCHETKPIGEYYTSRSGNNSWTSSYCKPCCVIKASERSKKNPELLREYQLRGRAKRFGTTAEWFKATLAAQQGVCAICKHPETDTFKNTGRLKALAIDHCHKTKKVRGLLCTKCNQSLFLLEKHHGWAEEAVRYLERHASSP